MTRRPTKTQRRTESLADQLDRVPTAARAETSLSGRCPSPANNSSADQPCEENLTPEGKRIRELFEEMRLNVPESVKKRFEEWESAEFVPDDFETAVAVDSLESHVGYSSLFRQLHHDYQRQIAYYTSQGLRIDEARSAAFHACTTTEEALMKLNVLLSVPL